MTESPVESNGSANDLNNVIDVLAKQEGALEFGAIEIGPDGQLTSRDPGVPIHFRFHYKGQPFDVKVDTSPGGKIQLMSNLGQVPYTAESPVGRRYAQRLIRHSLTLPRSRIYLDDQDHVCLEATCARPEKAGMIQVLSGISALMLDVLPHLRFLAEVLPRETRWAKEH